jgi:hypothetical protein
MRKLVLPLFCVTVMLSVSLYAADTVYVTSDATTGTEGNLNNAVSAVITADPTGAQLSNTVFKLEPYGYYILTATITTPPHAHLTVVADPPGTTQETAPPQIVWSNSGGVTTTLNFDCYGDVTMKNIWILSSRTSGAQVGSSLVIEDDSLANLSGKGEILDMDGCIYDYMAIGNGGGAIEPACQHFRARIVNTYFRNMTDPHYRYYGRPVSWTYQSTTWHTDTLIFENCTLANCGYAYMQEAPCYADYVIFNHCTIVNTMMHTLESSYWWNLAVTNTIYMNAWLYGDIPSQDGMNMTPNGGIVNVDSVATFGFDVPFTDSSEAPAVLQRHILISNNSYAHDQWYIDFLASNAYNDTAIENNKINLMPAMSGKTYRYFFAPEVKGNFPYIKMANIYPSSIDADTTRGFNDPAADPGFILNPCNIDSIKAFLLGRWATGVNVSWAYDPASDIQQGWPMNEDLSYTNATLKTAAMGGFPLGDLYHWWPTQYTAWKAQAAAERAAIETELNTPVGVEKQPGVPMEYGLAQNYPNPFNPTTRISYSVPKQSHVSLKVYNLTGQLIATLFDGVQSAGNYTATFNGKTLASGVYFYRLQADGVSITKKLTLIK